jgi:hypothetical protein
MTEFKTGDRVEVRDYDNTEWWPRIFVAKVDCPHPYVVREEGKDWGMTFAQCRHEVVKDPEVGLNYVKHHCDPITWGEVQESTQSQICLNQ